MNKNNNSENKIVVGGYISVRTVLQANKRDVYSLIIDKKRYEKVRASGFDANDKRRYDTLFKIANERNIPVKAVSPEEFSQISSGNTDGGFAAYVGERKFPSSDEFAAKDFKFSVILDGIEDPFNFGYTLRTLYAAGVDFVVMPPRSFSFSEETVIRSSAGASELLNITVCDDIPAFCKKIKEKNACIVSTLKSDKAKSLFAVKLCAPVCLIIGGEKRGISNDILSCADMSVKIKYARNCSFSLPAVSAASVIAFETAKKLKLM